MKKHLKRSVKLVAISCLSCLTALNALKHSSVTSYADSFDQVTINVNDADNLENVVTSSGYGDQTFLNYLGLSAQKLANNNDLYASVMLAQALLESGWGTSTLAQAPNYNLFGVKGSFQGSAVNMATQEDDGSGNLYGIQANFRKYPSYRESLEDYVRLLRDNGMYSGAWRSKTSSYKDATSFLTGRYATDTAYADKLNSLIEKYNLTRFDQPVDATQPSVNDIVVNNVSLVTNDVNHNSTRNTYQNQQAPVIVRNKFQNPAADAAITNATPTPALPVIVNNSLNELINTNKEILQAPSAKPSNRPKNSKNEIDFARTIPSEDHADPAAVIKKAPVLQAKADSNTQPTKSAVNSIQVQPQEDSTENSPD